MWQLVETAVALTLRWTSGVHGWIWTGLGRGQPLLGGEAIRFGIGLAVGMAIAVAVAIGRGSAGGKN